MLASYEELLTEIRLLRQEVFSLKAENTRLREENAHLREQLKLNSKTVPSHPQQTKKAKMMSPRKRVGQSRAILGIFGLYFQKTKLILLSTCEQNIVRPVEKRYNYRAIHHRYTNK